MPTNRVFVERYVVDCYDCLFGEGLFEIVCADQYSSYAWGFVPKMNILTSVTNCGIDYGWYWTKEFSMPKLTIEDVGDFQGRPESKI